PVPTVIYTLSLHDALPICRLADGARLRAEGRAGERAERAVVDGEGDLRGHVGAVGGERLERELRAVRRVDVDHRVGREDRQRSADRKSTRLNSSHLVISYA